MAGLFLLLALPCFAQVNSWNGGTPFNFFAASKGQLDHYEFALFAGIPEYQEPHGLIFDNYNAVTKFPCPQCWTIGQNKHGELWFAIWREKCDPAGTIRCSFVGRFADDTLIEDDEVTGEGLLWRRFHGTISGRWYINGKSCDGVLAFFDDAADPNPSTQISTGFGGLDVRVWKGECQ